MQTPRSHSNRRPAFTLVEMIVVLAIILVLVGLTTLAFTKAVVARRHKNTEATLQKLSAQVQRQMDAVIADAKTEVIPQNVLSLAGQDPNRARVLWIKLRLQQQFPVSYAEALVPGGGYITPEPSYGPLLKSRSAAINPATESAACLLMALTARNRRGAMMDADFLNSQEMSDTDNDGVPEIIDGYGNAIYFYRWPMPPTTDPNPNNYTMINGWDAGYQAKTAANGFHDPQDPTGSLQAPGWTGASKFASICHPLTGSYPGLYLVPVMVSAGPDGYLGLNLPNPSPNPNAMGLASGSTNGIPNSVNVLDNIYSNPTLVTQ